MTTLRLSRDPASAGSSAPVWVVAALLGTGCSTAIVRNDAHAVHRYSAFGQDRFAVVNDRNIHYVEAGSGQPVVLIPGAFSTYRVWNRMLPTLAERYRVIAIDYVGAGDSDKPDEGFDYTVAEQADVVAALIRALDLRAPILAGVSYGSAIALNVAARYPDLPAKVACIEGGMLISSDLLNYSRCFSLFGVPGVGDSVLSCMRMGWFNRICSRTIMGDAWDHLGPKVQAEIVAIQSSFIDTASSVAMYRIYCSITSQIDFTAEMARVRTPILYLYGESSQYRAIAEANIAFFQDHALDVDIIRLADGIHDLQLQFPTEVARIMMQHWDAAPDVASTQTQPPPRTSPTASPSNRRMGSSPIDTSSAPSTNTPAEDG